MSTFGGLMLEFPDVRVDYFRTIEGVRPPLACFLSHVHSDHLAGLESLKAPFVYCSAATREILVRLERYPHRINYERGILESRKLHYRLLKNLLRPIPLETPTTIELSPGNEIQVTLFDANHCTGAVMFLIEGSGKAVLYTGDIRSEPWFVNNLRRNPFLIEYTSGLKVLDCIYLDTSFTEKTPFPSKAEGITELLQKVAKYPPNTIFHFSAWTYGYEEVWLALSRALKSKIHVDDYKWRIYQSLRGIASGGNVIGQHLAPEGPPLAGFKVGNHIHEGILTQDENVRVHSCEKGTECKVHDAKNNIVWIRPIITRIGSTDVGEIGVGGGGGDLAQWLEFDLDVTTQELISSLSNAGYEVNTEMKDMLIKSRHSTRNPLSLDHAQFDPSENLSLEDFMTSLTRYMAQKHTTNKIDQQVNGLSKFITFPFSRHSSYFELRDLVSAFMPLDVYPCTVDPLNWNERVSMRYLFGDQCSGDTFRHDGEMLKIHNTIDDSSQESQSTSHFNPSQDELKVQEAVPPTKLVNELQDIIPYPGLNTGDSHDIATTSGSKNFRLQKKSEDRLELLDEYGQSVSFSVYNKSKASSIDVKGALMPSSPVSGSPGIRRKASFRDDETCNKRTKTQNDDVVSADECVEDEYSQLSPYLDQGSFDAVGGVSYFDKKDDVFRCVECGWEVWRPSGTCTNCGSGSIPYYEVLDSSKGNPDKEKDDPRPGIVPDDMNWEEDEIDPHWRMELTGNFLDGVSAYSSANDGENEYEINSFIDDASLHAEQDDEVSSSSDSEEDDIDYKALYQQMSVQYGALLDDHNELMDNHELLRRDLLGSAYGDPLIDSDIDSLSDAIFPLVNVEVQDPPISEFIVPFQGDSQASVLSAGRAAVREDAFNAALDVEGQGWHDVSIMSTGDNHSRAELEL